MEVLTKKRTVQDVQADAGGSEFPRGTIQVGGDSLLWTCPALEYYNKQTWRLSISLSRERERKGQQRHTNEHEQVPSTRTHGGAPDAVHSTFAANLVLLDPFYVAGESEKPADVESERGERYYSAGREGWRERSHVQGYEWQGKIRISLSLRTGVQ